MKRNLFIRFLCLMLAVVTAFSFAGCNAPQTDPGQTESQAETQAVAKPPSKFIPTADYVIVYSQTYEADAQIQKACRYLKAALYEVYGIKLDIVDDSTPINAKKEFLVGNTNRADSQKAADMLDTNDYVYSVVSDSAIVICGGVSDATYTAVKQFCTDVLTFDGMAVTTPNVEIKVKTKHEFYAEYPYESLVINGILWEEYALVISDEKDMFGAVEINRLLGQYTGQMLPVIKASEMTGEEQSIIRVGAAYRDGKKSSTLSGYTVNSYTDEKGNVICIEASTNAYYANAVAALVSKGKKEEGTNTVNYTFEKQFFYQTNTENKDGSGKMVETVQWDLEQETIEQLGEGLTYSEQVYYDDRGLPHRVYTLVIDSNLYDFTMGTSKDGYDFYYTDLNAQKQTVEQHMQEAIKNGKNAIAGVNGDQFYIEGRELGDYRPDGLTIKDGKVISKGEPTRPSLVGTTERDRAFFGITKDGKPIIAMESEYVNNAAKLATLQTAIGANIKLAENGATVYYKTHRNIGHGTTSDSPRTVYGYDKDGRVILMCVDGRSLNHSNGAWLLQLSLLMHQFGASDVVQLDGGGSTCMVLRNPDTNAYETVNKPSDGQLRKVYNSLLVLKKDS